MKKRKGLAYSVLFIPALLIFFLPGCMQESVTEDSIDVVEGDVLIRPDEVTAAEALQLLEEGNRRFTDGLPALKDAGSDRRRTLSREGQKPFAVIVGCSDSRVPPEVVFDWALGDLFVVRTAGNIVDPVALGSVEYAVEHLGVPLVVVLGHEACGAVKGN